MNGVCNLIKQYAPLAGRVLLASIFLISGYSKVGAFAGVAAGMAGKGIPLPEAALVVTIVIELGGALMLILGWKARWAALVIFLWLIPVTLLYHDFWTADAAQYRNQLNHFLKNVAIMGGLLYVLAFGAGPLSADTRAREGAGRT